MQVARSKRKFNPSCLLHNRGASELTSLVILLRYTGLHEHWITQCHRTFDIIHLQRGSSTMGVWVMALGALSDTWIDHANTFRSASDFKIFTFGEHGCAVLLLHAEAAICLHISY